MPGEPAARLIVVVMVLLIVVVGACDLGSGDDLDAREDEDRVAVRAG
jgi:hypothetical protein